MRLALPAHEGAAIEFYGEGEAGHMIMFVKLLAFGLAALAPTPSPSLEREGLIEGLAIDAAARWHVITAEQFSG
jgi:hypothetical protein